MKIPITIGSETFDLTESQIQFIKEKLRLNGKKLRDIPVGKTFKLDEYEFIVLEHTDNGTNAILKTTLSETIFSIEGNDYNKSSIRRFINGNFLDSLIKICGFRNIYAHNVDLISNDGRTEYGCVPDRVSLLTSEMYRKYVYILDKYPTENWWWLATPWSTREKENDCVCVICPNGTISKELYGNECFVRPFVILNSEIIVMC